MSVGGLKVTSVKWKVLQTHSRKGVEQGTDFVVNVGFSTKSVVFLGENSFETKHFNGESESPQMLRYGSCWTVTYVIEERCVRKRNIKFMYSYFFESHKFSTLHKFSIPNFFLFFLFETIL